MITVNSIDEMIAAINNINFPEVNYRDNGIGAYEYWGSKGVDKRMEWEIEGDIVKIKLNFEDPEDEVEFVVEDTVYEVQSKLYTYLNKHNDDDIDFSDIVKLESVIKENVLTLEWVEA